MSKEQQSETEGVIQFSYELEAAESGEELSEQQLALLNHWRQRMIEAAVLGGGEADRYDGLGYGNVSARVAAGKPEFIITASQTGTLKSLKASDYALITAVDLNSFSVKARGSSPPSSETLTHAMIYQGDPEVNLVLHAHAPTLWQRAEDMHLPFTPPEIGYGSPEMACYVTQLMAESSQRPDLFATLGHQDGIFAYGPDPDETGFYLMQMLDLAEAGRGV